MSKKKKALVSSLFNEKLDITTKDKSFYHIRKVRVLIHEKDKDYYGKVLTITSNKYSKDNVHIIQAFYDDASDEKRIRFRIRNLHNATKIRSIEHLPNGIERPVAIIDYDYSTEYICSIGDITSVKSDIKIPENNHSIKNNLILRLLLPKDYFMNIDREEKIKKAA